MRLIDADSINWESVEEEHGARTPAVVACQSLIQNAPTIDPVRCGMATEIIESLLNLIQEICADQRERHKDDSVCGLCEYDGPSWMECPGYEREDCFLLKRDVRAKYYIPYDPVRHGKWEYAEDEVLDDLTFSAWKCSRCGYYAYKPELWHYCPNCGARMEIEGE